MLLRKSLTIQGWVLPNKKMVSFEIDFSNVIVVSVIGSISLIAIAIFIYFSTKKNKPKKEDDWFTDSNTITNEQINKIKESFEKPVESVKLDKKEKQYFVQYEDKLITKEKFENTKFYVEADARDYFIRSKWTIRYWIERRRRKKKPHKIVLVRFELNNGKFREFTVPQTDSFLYAGNRYIFDLKLKYQNLDAGGIWCYDFHESLCLPIKQTIKFTDEIEKLIIKINSSSKKQLSKPLDKRIDINDIKDSIESSGVIETETSLNPTVLQRLIESEIAQGVLRGATLGRTIKILFILVIIILLVTSIDVLVDVSTSGLIEDLNPSKKEG